MTTEFTWTWKTKILGQIYDVKIYKDNVLFGHIPDIFLNEIAVIKPKVRLKLLFSMKNTPFLTSIHITCYLYTTSLNGLQVIVLHPSKYKGTSKNSTKVALQRRTSSRQIA